MEIPFFHVVYQFKVWGGVIRWFLVRECIDIEPQFSVEFVVKRNKIPGTQGSVNCVRTRLCGTFI